MYFIFSLLIYWPEPVIVNFAGVDAPLLHPFKTETAATTAKNKAIVTEIFFISTPSSKF
jgi:hypothetical protein